MPHGHSLERRFQRLAAQQQRKQHHLRNAHFIENRRGAAVTETLITIKQKARALWSSLTHLLLHLAHRPPRRANKATVDSSTNTPLQQPTPVEQQPQPLPRSTPRPAAPPHHLIEEGPHTSIAYRELNERLNQVVVHDQIPNKSFGSLLLKGGEV
ncbi:hypothetical protein EAI_04449 [Harpegnathos saltator]|uniref:Uncharacterized protein n=1 Tax=Harpegnathos saltator TaxID=610380 RepID=E2B4X6_HARSA|nr:hypothetical protein EAI_04449 [Harpegnathos saltator]